jgi:hypothetical protein
MKRNEPREQVGDSTGHLLLLCYSYFIWVVHLGLGGIPISIAFPNLGRLGTRAERARRNRISPLSFLPIYFWPHD